MKKTNYIKAEVSDNELKRCIFWIAKRIDSIDLDDRMNAEYIKDFVQRFICDKDGVLMYDIDRVSLKIINKKNNTLIQHV